MYDEDRYHTIGWDAEEIDKRTRAAGPETPESDEEPATSSRTAPVRKKKRRGMNPFLGFILWAVIVAVSSVVLASVGWSLASDFAALNSTDRTEVSFEVKEEWVSETKVVENEDGTTQEVKVCDVQQVAEALHEQGLVQYPWFFRLFGWLYHADEKIAQGTYTLNTEMDYMALIRGMRASSSAVTVDVVIPEGYTVWEIIQILAENGVGTADDLMETAMNYDFEGYSFLTNDSKGTLSRLEGYLFPDTYNFYVGGRPELAFQSMLNNFDKKVAQNEDLAALFEESPYDLGDIINIASLIEKETDGGDRENIASVIYNRLNNAGETNYLLQIDAALVYATGRPITQSDYTELDSPYNLYQHTGLPPTPIANPGIASIMAALQPADTNYYFYALGSDGKHHVFSETLAEHNDVLAGLGQ